MMENAGKCIPTSKSFPLQRPKSLELYAHDFSEFHDLNLGEDGRFGYRALSLYWSEPHRYPFLIRTDGKLAGLVLVKKGSEISGEDDVWDMAEFFVIRGCRRRGIGTKVAHDVWNRLPGRWEVRVLHSNVSAQQFWAKAVATFAGHFIAPVRIQKSGECWNVSHLNPSAAWRDRRRSSS
jgi:predicted acetyltransferase